MPRLYDCFVVLYHVKPQERIYPITRVYATKDIDLPHILNGFHLQDVSTGNPLAVWLVEHTNKANAADLVIAHQAGHAPHGVTCLYDKNKVHE